MNNEIQPSKTKRIVVMPILTLFAIAYFGFLLYQAVYVNYKTNQKIDQYTQLLQQKKTEQESLKALIAYYQTSTFQELEARKKLGLKMPGEKVVKVEVPQAKRTPQDIKKEVDKSDDKPNYIHWADYLFSQ